MSKIKKGQKWRYIGDSGEFYTFGQSYAVICEPPEGEDYFQLEDDRREGRPHHWADDATFHAVFERSEGPVITETVKTIKEGVYGLVRVDVHRSSRVIYITPEDGHQASPEQLRAAAATLTEIADALDGPK
jgi:hypothetical protein